MPDGQDAWIPDSTYAGSIALSANGHDALVWQSFNPFRVWRIGGVTDQPPVKFQQVTGDWFDNNIARSLHLDPGIWNTTSVVAIGPGYAQTMAHRGTDQRLLLWFNSNGRFARYTTVDAAFGLVDSATIGPVVLAIRTLNNTELVKYSWERVPDSTGSAGEER